MKEAGSYSLPELYGQRFSEKERDSKNAIWRVLCRDFFQKYISASDVVVDLGAGYCEFINNIRCGKKFAVDLSEAVREFAHKDVSIILSPASDLSAFQDASVDAVFASNLFEHLKSKDELMDTLREVNRILRHGGRLLVLQPNIHYAYREYWDYLDHYLPLTHISLTEALHLAGFDVPEVRPRFLPFSMKNRLPKASLLLRIYLRAGPLHWIFGRQMFLLAAKRGG